MQAMRPWKPVELGPTLPSPLCPAVGEHDSQPGITSPAPRAQPLTDDVF